MPAGEPPPLDELQRRWGELGRTVLVAGRRDLAVAIAGSRLVACEAGTASISLAPSRAAPVDLTLLHPFLGSLAPWVVRLVAATAEADPDAAARVRRYQEAEAHPVVRLLKQRFAAETVGREPRARAEWRERHPGNEGPAP